MQQQQISVCRVQRATTVRTVRYLSSVPVVGTARETPPLTSRCVHGAPSTLSLVCHMCVKVLLTMYSIKGFLKALVLAYTIKNYYHAVVHCSWPTCCKLYTGSVRGLECLEKP